MTVSDNLHVLDLSSRIVAATVQALGSRISPDEVPTLLCNVHSTAKRLAFGTQATAPKPVQAVDADEDDANEFRPAVSVKKSLANDDFILSMIDGKPYKMLRRHLKAHGLTDVEYRARYGLTPDYPMVAPNYSANRSKLAKDMGLGTKFTRSYAA